MDREGGCSPVERKAGLEGMHGEEANRTRSSELTHRVITIVVVIENQDIERVWC